MNLLPLFQWCEESGIGRTVRESVWAFAVIESTHLLSLVMLGGSVLLVDLRILNLGLRQRPVGELVRETQPFARIGLVVLLASGLALFSSEAVKCYYSFPFWVKMGSLAAAISASMKGVSTVPGTTPFTRIPSCTRSAARLSVMLWIAPLDAE